MNIKNQKCEGPDCQKRRKKNEKQWTRIGSGKKDDWND